ncbi:MAG: class I SAM-dependent methyltransferase [Gammaproteobacteria bacterium]
MAADERERWEAKHTAEQEPGEPAAFLRQIFQTGPWEIQPGRALDIATGKGRNALFLAEQGFTVDAIDISEVGLQQAQRQAEKQGLTLNLVQADLASFEFPDSAYDLILNINFLLRSLVPKIKNALLPGGYIIFDTYLLDQQDLGHPRNPAYLLNHNELLDLFRGFRILCYQEGKFFVDGKESFRAELLGQKHPGPRASL